MSQKYDGLPAASTVEKSIVLAQRMIQRDLELRAKASPDLPGSIRVPDQTAELKKAS